MTKSVRPILQNPERSRRSFWLWMCYTNRKPIYRASFWRHSLGPWYFCNATRNLTIPKSLLFGRTKCHHQNLVRQGVTYTAFLESPWMGQAGYQKFVTHFHHFGGSKWPRRPKNRVFTGFGRVRPISRDGAVRFWNCRQIWNRLDERKRMIYGFTPQFAIWSSRRVSRLAKFLAKKMLKFLRCGGRQNYRPTSTEAAACTAASPRRHLYYIQSPGSRANPRPRNRPRGRELDFATVNLARARSRRHRKLFRWGFELPTARGTY